MHLYKPEAPVSERVVQIAFTRWRFGLV